MKKFLFIGAILCSLLILMQQEKADYSVFEESMAMQEELQIDKNDWSDFEHKAFIISKDLKGSNCLTPRRTATSISNILHLRSIKTHNKMTEYFRIKGTNQLKMISEKVITCQTINYISLLTRNGYHVFGLRKLII